MRIRKNRRPSVVLILIFVALAAGIIFVATLYSRHYKQTYRRNIEGQLSAIAEIEKFVIVTRCRHILRIRRRKNCRHFPFSIRP